MGKKCEILHYCSPIDNNSYVDTIMVYEFYVLCREHAQLVPL